MGTGVPEVTIGVPVFNGENYLREALDSIAAQTFERFSVRLCDNASTDRTWAICEEYAERDPRFSLYPSATNNGAAWNYNRSFEGTATPFFMWVAHDDRIGDTFLERAVSVLRDDPQVSLCYAKTRFIDAEGAPVAEFDDDMHLQESRSSQRFERFLRHHRTPTFCNPVFGLYRTEVLRRTQVIGPYPSSDMILLAEMALQGKVHELASPHFERRDHPKRSLASNPTPEERAEWFVPGSGKQRRYPRWRWLREYLLAIERAPMPQAERLRCLRVLFDEYVRVNGFWLNVEARTLLGIYKRKLLRRPEPSSAK